MCGTAGWYLFGCEELLFQAEFAGPRRPIGMGKKGVVKHQGAGMPWLSGDLLEDAMPGTCRSTCVQLADAAIP